MEGGIHVRRDLLYGESEVRREVSVFEHQLGDAKLQVGIVVGGGRRLARGLPWARETTTDQGVEVEGSRGAGGGKLGRAEKVTAWAVVAEGLVAAGTVVQRDRVAERAVETVELVGAKGCVAARAVGTAEAAGARGCVEARAVKTAEVARARGCVAARAVETVEVAGARGCWAAGVTKVARLAEAGC